MQDSKTICAITWKLQQQKSIFMTEYFYKKKIIIGQSCPFVGAMIMDMSFCTFIEGESSVGVKSNI